MVYVTESHDIFHGQLTAIFCTGGSKGCTHSCAKARGAVAQSRKCLLEGPAQQRCLSRRQLRFTNDPGYERE